MRTLPRLHRAPALLRVLMTVLMTVLLTAPWLAAAPAWAACELQTMTIPVRTVNARPVATLVLNGVEVPMLVDSGAFYSFLTPSLATQLDLPLRNLPWGFRIDGYTGRVAARQTRVKTVGLVNAELNGVDFIVGGNELGAGIMGILGRNILSLGDTEYDLAQGLVRLTFPKGDCDDANFAYWAGEAPVVVVPMEGSGNRADTAIRVQAGINGSKVEALLDTGAPQTTLTLRAARKAGIEERELRPAGRLGGAGEGRVNRWIGDVALFELGGEKITNNQLAVADTDSSSQGMLIGLDYFLSHRIYVSRLQRKVYATWNGVRVFAQGRWDATEHDTRYAAVPEELPTDDADALARRGTAALAAGNRERALADLNRACTLAPTVASYFLARARVHLAMRSPRPALADMDEALRLQPALAEARSLRTVLRAGMGDRAGAQADLAELDAGLPPSSHLRASMANLHAQFDEVPQALRQFQLWIETHQQDAHLADVLNQRCWMRARLDIDLPLALADCKAAVDKDAGASANRTSLGWTYLRLGDAARAKKAFDGALELQALPWSLYGRGLAQLRLQDTELGQRDLDAARKLRPQIDAEVRKAGFGAVAGPMPAAVGP